MQIQVLCAFVQITQTRQITDENLNTNVLLSNITGFYLLHHVVCHRVHSSEQGVAVHQLHQHTDIAIPFHCRHHTLINVSIKEWFVWITDESKCSQNHQFAFGRSTVAFI